MQDFRFRLKYFFLPAAFPFVLIILFFSTEVEEEMKKIRFPGKYETTAVRCATLSTGSEESSIDLKNFILREMFCDMLNN